MAYIGSDPSISTDSTTMTMYVSHGRVYYFDHSYSNYSQSDMFNARNLTPGLVYQYARFLSREEKAYLRKINMEPTREGVETFQECHQEALRRICSPVCLPVRYNRRVPRWRSGRWKSLC